MKKWIGCCAGISLFILLLGALLLLVGLPAVLEYLGSLDVEVVFDLQAGDRYIFDDWDLVVTGIHDAEVDFVVMATGAPMESGEAFTLALSGAGDSAFYTLPDGYVIRLIEVYPDRVRIQWFVPVQEE